MPKQKSGLMTTRSNAYEGDQEKNCPYCDKKGTLEGWYNHYTDEMNNNDECPACNGTGICEDQLMLDHAEANLESDELILECDESQRDSDELPF